MVAKSNQEVRKFVAPELVMGPGVRFLAGRYARHLGASKVLLVTDPGVAAAGWARSVRETLEEADLRVTLFQEVSPNPRETEVMAGVRDYQGAGCSLILVVGGGSPMDCAKGIGIVSTNGGHILDYEGVDRLTEPIPPLICIPTTAGTSADVSQFCIITDTRNRNKIAILSKAIVPDVSLLDPETLVTMPAALTVHTAFDALTHGIEAYVSTGGSPLTDLLALEAVRLIANHLLPCLANPTDVEFRKPVMLASLNAGLAFSNASLGIVHAMAHSLGGLLDMPHGLCNSLLLKVCVGFNFPAVPERFRAIATAMGLSAHRMSHDRLREALLDKIEEFRTAAGIRTSLSREGVQPADLPSLTTKALNDACLVTNPREPTFADVERLYEEAL